MHRHFGDTVIMNKRGDYDKNVENLMALKLNKGNGIKKNYLKKPGDEYNRNSEHYPYIAFSRKKSFGYTKRVNNSADDVKAAH